MARFVFPLGQLFDVSSSITGTHVDTGESISLLFSCGATGDFFVLGFSDFKFADPKSPRDRNFDGNFIVAASDFIFRATHLKTSGRTPAECLVYTVGHLFTWIRSTDSIFRKRSDFLRNDVSRVAAMKPEHGKADDSNATSVGGLNHLRQ